MGFLESVELDETRQQKELFRMPVQWVNRPDLDFRGFAGTISSGMVKPGDAIRAQPSGRESRVARIVTANGDLPLAVAGQSITLTLADEIDISRGDVISAAPRRRRSPTSSSAPSSGWPRSRCCPAAPTC